MRENNYLYCEDPKTVLKESLLDVIYCLIHVVSDKKGFATSRKERKFGVRFNPRVVSFWPLSKPSKQK